MQWYNLYVHELWRKLVPDSKGLLSTDRNLEPELSKYNLLKKSSPSFSSITRLQYFNAGPLGETWSVLSDVDVKVVHTVHCRDHQHTVLGTTLFKYYKSAKRLLVGGRTRRARCPRTSRHLPRRWGGRSRRSPARCKTLAGSRGWPEHQSLVWLESDGAK